MGQVSNWRGGNDRIEAGPGTGAQKAQGNLCRVPESTAIPSICPHFPEIKKTGQVCNSVFPISALKSQSRSLHITYARKAGNYLIKASWPRSTYYLNSLRPYLQFQLWGWKISETHPTEPPIFLNVPALQEVITVIAPEKFICPVYHDEQSPDQTQEQRQTGSIRLFHLANLC